MLGGAEDPDNPETPPWRTGFAKLPRTGAVQVFATNLEGDGQANLKHHGGPDKAVLAYSADHYPAWRAELGRPEFPHGGLGENLTIEGFDEDSVCIGDVIQVGGQVRLQVTQPRQPCANISRRWGIPDLTRRVQQTGRTGWYLRVLEPGAVEAGMPVALLERLHPAWTVTRAMRTMQARPWDPALTQELGSLPELSGAWRSTLVPVVKA